MMQLEILNTSFVNQVVLDNYSIDSVVWIERYNKAGQFEIYAKFSTELLNVLQQGYYIISKESSRVMIIETIQIKTDAENGHKLVVSGRTIESLLDRRIMFRQLQLDTTLQSAIDTILTTNLINSQFPERNFPNFIFSTSSDPLVTAPTLKAQYYGQNIYDTICELCLGAKLGFKVTLNSSNQMVFALYAGKDRSYSQSTNPYVIFSREFENLVSSDYVSTKQFKKNYVIVIGEQETSGLYPWVQVWTADVGTGLARLETHVDASDTPRINQTTGTPINDTAYFDQLRQRGWDELAISTELTSFDAKVVLANTYKYGTDFELGDIVQLIDDFGHSARLRVTEMTISEDVNNGYNIYPTLETL